MNKEKNIFRKFRFLGIFVIFCTAWACESVDLGFGVKDFSTDATIVNGTRAPQNTFLTDGEVLAVIFLADEEGYPFCSGTVVDSRVVVTAQHCVQGRNPNKTLIGFGEQPGAEAQYLPVSEFHPHPDEDFAVVILGLDAVQAVAGLEPIAINRESLNGDWIGTMVDGAGYGNTYSNDTGRFFASVEIHRVRPHRLTVDGNGQQGLCYGDSGGPVIYQPDAETPPVVLGTEQWGSSSCVDKDHLSRLDMLADWVDDVLAQPLPEPLIECGDVDYFGYCDGNKVFWCATDYLRNKNCGDQNAVCGFMGPEWGFDCLPSSCGDVDYLGECDGDSLSWCRYSGLGQQNCADQGLACVWRNDETGYACDDCFQCDGVCTDLDTSTAHCGACGRSCNYPNAFASCVDGECSMLGCESNFSDDDGDPLNGCEVNLAPVETEDGKKLDLRLTGSGCQSQQSPPFLLLILGLILFISRIWQIRRGNRKDRAENLSS